MTALLASIYHVGRWYFCLRAALSSARRRVEESHAIGRLERGEIE